MNTSIQIEGLKSQIENMRLQIGNIQMQNNNMLMMNNQVVEQLFNLSIQLFNTGIQSFNIAKNMIMIMDTKIFYDQLRKISEQINSIINENDLNNMQQQMMQQQMMQQQMIQQQMLQQQMMQQQMMQQQMINKQNMNTQDGPQMSVEFKNIHEISKIITVPYGTTIKELLNKYLKRINSFDNEKIIFLYNATKINRNEQKKVIDYFKPNLDPKIAVIIS